MAARTRTFYRPDRDTGLHATFREDAILSSIGQTRSRGHVQLHGLYLSILAANSVAAPRDLPEETDPAASSGHPHGGTAVIARSGPSERTAFRWISGGHWLSVPRTDPKPTASDWRSRYGERTGFPQSQFAPRVRNLLDVGHVADYSLLLGARVPRRNITAVGAAGIGVSSGTTGGLQVSSPYAAVLGNSGDLTGSFSHLGVGVSIFGAAGEARRSYTVIALVIQVADCIDTAAVRAGASGARHLTSASARQLERQSRGATQRPRLGR